MKAITLWEPWATAIARGLKRIETRGWATRYRGPLAIHAAARKVTLFDLPGLAPHFAGADVTEADLAFGCVVATATLARVVRVEDIRDTLSPRELVFGNYNDGRYAWVLEDITRLANPAPAQGRQGLWSYNP